MTRQPVLDHIADDLHFEMRIGNGEREARGAERADLEIARHQRRNLRRAPREMHRLECVALAEMREDLGMLLGEHRAQRRQLARRVDPRHAELHRIGEGRDGNK